MTGDAEQNRRPGRPRLDLDDDERKARKRKQAAERQKRRRERERDRKRNGARPAIIAGDAADEIDAEGDEEFSRRVSEILRRTFLRDFA